MTPRVSFHVDGGDERDRRTQICRVVPSGRNSVRMGVEPRSEAMEKYEIVVVKRTMTAIWWNRRLPLGLCVDVSAVPAKE